MKQRANPKCATIAVGKAAAMRPVKICLSMISRSAISTPLKLCRTSVIGALLLMLHAVSAGLDGLDETDISGSSSGGDSGQRVRELGRPLYRTFTRRDEGIVNKILTGVQDPRGLMVFGSINCVLEYDGQRWTSIPLPNSSWIQALACDTSGTIYVGGIGEIGALVLAGCTHRYKSYTSLVPASWPHL